MKKFIAILSCCLAFCAIQASVPNKMKHQGAIYLLTNRPLINQNVVIKVSIEKENAGGEVVFSETHNLTTDNFGYFQLEIGSGNVLLGNFTLIDWSAGNYFVKTEYSSDNGTTYSTIGNSQLLSVPYAYCAGNFSKFPQGNAFGDMLFWENEQWNILPIGAIGQYLGIKNREQTPSWIDIPNCKLDALRQYGEAPTEGNTSENTNFPYIGYQIVARNQQLLYVNRTMDIKISILKGSNNGTVVYQETFEAASDANGIVSLMIGSGEPLTGSFQLIDWSSGNYFIQHQIDPNRTDNYTISNTEPILSVPYAFCVYSESINTANGDLLFWNGNNWASLPIGNENDILVVAKNNTPTWIAPEVVSDDFEQLPNMSGVVDSILFSRYDTTQLSLSSSQVSRILIAQYPDGSKKYVDGAIIGETGLFLQLDNDYPERRRDTIWANRQNAFVFEMLQLPSNMGNVEWKAEDPSIIRITDVYNQDEKRYATIEALRTGETQLIAYVQGMEPDTIDVIVDSRYVKSLRYVVQGPAGTYEAESTTGTLYDVDHRAEIYPEARKDQYVLTAKVDAEENGGQVSFPVTWEIVGGLDTINDLKLTYIGENKESLMIETRKVDGKGLLERLNEGKTSTDRDYIRSLDVTVKARAAYFSIDALLSIKPKNEIKKIESVEWRELYHETEGTMDELEITTESKTTPAPIVLTALGNPSVIDHLVGGYRFGIVGEEGYLDYSKTSIKNEYIRLESTSETREGGKVGIRGLKSGIVQIWVEIGDAALGGNFTLEKYGEPKRAELTVNILNVVSSLKVYKEENMSTAIGTNMQTMTVGDEQVFVAQIEDAEAHEEFKGSIEWVVENNDGGAISIYQNPTDKTRVTVMANSAAGGNNMPRLYAKVTDTKGKETVSAMFRIEVEEAASDEASDLEFTSASVRWEDFYSFGSDYYTYVFTTAAGDELVIPASDPDMMGMGYNAYMFDEERTWTIGENGDEDIFIMSGPGIGITISASGTEYRIKSGTITISGGGTSALIDLMAVPVVGGVEGTETPVTGTWSGTKPADPRP